MNISNNHKRCFQEISILKILKHPNIVRIYDVIEHEDNISIIMEYATEGDLYSLVQAKGKLSEDEARNIFRQLIFGIEYAHIKGIAH